MRTAATLVAALTLLAPLGRADDAKNLKVLEGTWTVAEESFDGEDVPKDVAKNTTYTFDGNKMTLKGGLAKMGTTFVPLSRSVTFKVQVDHDGKNRTIDLTTDDGKKIPGIYKIEKGKLTLCIGWGGERPKEFSTKGQAGVGLSTSAREKKESKDGEPACQDETAIEWFLPGDFEAARKRAAADKRFLMIKGIAFGVDEEGAKCATKGSW